MDSIANGKGLSLRVRKKNCPDFKTLLIMKMTVLLIFIASLSANAHGNAQSISISVKNENLQSVFKEISKQTSYKFFYNQSLLTKSAPVTVDVKNVTIEQVLDACFKNQYLTYEIIGGTIVVKKKEMVEKKLAAMDDAFVLQSSLHGKVVNEKGEPLAGASVKIKGTDNGTTSNDNGAFTINVAEGNVLQISYVGYISQEITVGDGNDITITLKPSNNTAEAVVITALGIKRLERSTSYNVQTLGGNEVNTVNDASVADALVGKVAGATINPSASGVGGSVRVVLRGTKSITGNNNALYVVDGIPMPNLFTSQPSGVFNGNDNGDGIANLNPDDIESISILSGASAAALYGYEAANGVVLITTKKGTANKLKVNFSSSATFSSPFVLPQLQTTYGPSASGVNGPSMFSWGSKLPQPSSYKASDFFQTGTNFTNAVNVSTGTDRSQTYFSAAAVNADGIIQNNAYKRYNFSLHNTSILIPNKLTLDASAMLVSEERKNEPGQGEYNNPLIGTYLFPAGDIDSSNYVLNNYQVYNPSRNFNVQNWAFGDLGLEAQNPYWITNKEFTTINRSRFLGSVALKYTIADGLTLTGRVKYDNTNDLFNTKYYAGTINFIAGGPNGYFSDGSVNNRQTYADIMLNYAKKFNDISLNVVLGGSILDNKSSSDTTGGTLGLVPNFFSVSNIAQSNIVVKQMLPETIQNQAIFASAQFGYKNMLFLEASARNDWNSALAFTSSTSIFYPSVGLSAILSDMMKLPAAISFAKLRTSYSEVGNPPAPFISNPFPTINNSTLNVVTTAPFDLKPERTKSFEAGTDLRFANNKLNFSFTYYNANTYNQIFNVAIPSGASQYNSYYINAGKINNYGVEATLGYNAKFGAIQWRPVLTFSLNKNKIVQLLSNYTDPYTGKIQNQDTLVVSGASAYQQWLTKGGSAGDLYAQGLQKDANGNIITDANGLPSVSNTYEKVGNTNPKYNLGFSNGFSYKAFNLNFVVTARVGGQVISGTQALLDFYGASQASADARNNGGVLVNGQKVDAQQYYSKVAGFSGGGGNIALADYVYSATNVRLSELSFGYNFGSIFNNKISNFRLSLIARNLWMIYNKAPFDPEVSASTNTFFQGYDFFNQPSQRYIGVRLNLSF